MKKTLIRLAATLLIAGSIVIVLANNKKKIDAAANPVKETVVIPVKVHEVMEEAFNASFQVNGTTAPVKEVKIASEVQGKLVRLSIQNGDIVSAGQTVAVLDASVYTVQLSSVDASIAKANLDIDRYTRLIELGGATPMQLESVKLQHASLIAQRRQITEQISHMAIRAPFSGKIENVNVELGSFVTYGTVLSQLMDNSTLKINVYLSEKEAFRVKVDQSVTISSVVLKDVKHGYISMVSDKADASGKFLAEVSFKNNGRTEKLKAGMLADVYFPMEATESGLSIPVSALIGSPTDAKVYVVNGNKVEKRSVKTGVITPVKVQVTEGLQAGDKVVISGQLNLENGTTITINQ